jgi:hypothetical protein
MTCLTASANKFYTIRQCSYIICSNIAVGPAYGVYISQLIPIRISLIEGCCLQGSY